MSAPTDYHLKSFHQRFRSPIRKLMPMRHADFALAMIAFPILERWIRGKTGIGSCALRGKVGDKFYDELIAQFESLRDPPDGSFPRVAQAFWQAFRNGILHQTTFSRKPIEVLGITALPVFVHSFHAQGCRSSQRIPLGPSSLIRMPLLRPCSQFWKRTSVHTKQPSRSITDWRSPSGRQPSAY